MINEKIPSMFTISSQILEEWQNIVNLIGAIMHVPAALIMRIVDKDIEVFVASTNPDNPYHSGDKEIMDGSGLYCETVIKTKEKLAVPNALTDETWKNNPDIKLHMISYLGFPLFLPDGSLFGTICVLDKKENAYSTLYSELIQKFRSIIQRDLELLHMNYALGEKNKALIDYLNEIQRLRRIIPICSFCKKIRNDKNFWEEVEQYIANCTDIEFSHSVCPDCAQKHYAQYCT